jgi:hypothetical protein
MHFGFPDGSQRNRKIEPYPFNFLSLRVFRVFRGSRFPGEDQEARRSHPRTTPPEKEKARRISPRISRRALFFSGAFRRLPVLTDFPPEIGSELCGVARWALEFRFGRSLLGTRQE